MIKGNDNTIFKAVDANIPLAANVVALNSITSLVGGGPSGGSSGGSTGGTGTGGSSAGSRSQHTGNFLGNNIICKLTLFEKDLFI